jgi:nucleotide-binding universal stress UspA family protein
MIRKILVAYDTSEQASKAFDLALDLAQRYSAALVVLAVARPPEPPQEVETEAFIERTTEYFEGHFANLRESARRTNITPRFEVRVGHPADQIIHLANQEGVDMIVMGHRGKSVIQQWLLGSVSKRVISYAHCAVTIVR